MAAKKFRSRTFRRTHVRVPSGKSVLRFERRKPGKAQCGMCGDILKGVAVDLPYKVRKLAKTERRPERPYGGNLCSRCMRKKIIEKARMMANG